MCIICIKAKGKPLPEKRHLVSCDKNNSDGIGLCYWNHETGIIRIKKDILNPDHLYKYIKSKVKIEDSLIVHFRKATSGLIDVGNRHPFPLTQDGKEIRKKTLITNMAIVHNGVFSGLGGEKYSDTQEFIMGVMGNPIIKNNLKDKTIKALISNFIGSNRISIMLEDGDILMYGDYVVIKDDIIYSNSSYKAKKVWSKDCGKWVYEDELLPENKNIINTPKIDNNQKQIGFNNNKPNEIDANLIADDEKEVCEGCMNFKKTKLIKHKNQSYDLCRKCRKKWARGKLLLEKQNDLEQCEDCGNWEHKNELKTDSKIFGEDVKLCEKCLQNLLTQS